MAAIAWVWRGLALALIGVGVGRAERLPHSPFPVPRAGLNASRVLYALERVPGESAADALLASTLQGATSADTPRLYRARDVLSPTSAYGRWLNLTAAQFDVAVDTRHVRDLPGLVAVLAAQGHVTGYVLADAASVNTAVAACAALRGTVAVFAENESKAVAAGLTLAYDVRGRDTAWAIATFNNSGSGFVYSDRITVIQEPSKTTGFLADYAIATGALPWWEDDMDAPLVRQVLGALQPGYAAVGWGPDEKATVAAVSEAGGSVIPADWALNLDVLSAYELASFTPPPPPPAPLPDPLPAQHTVTFLMSDGDNVQFMLGDYAVSERFWASPDRGAAALGWTFAPGLAELAPAALTWYYETAARAGVANRTRNTDGRDVFVAGVSGVGYFYPDVVAEAADGARKLDALVASTHEMMGKAGTRLLNVLAEGNGLPPPGVAEALLDHEGVDALFWYPYDNYAGLRGVITWPLPGKPLVGGTFNLWGDGSDCGAFCNNAQTVARLLAAPRDPTRAAGYTLIPVHVWTHNVTDVAWITAELEAAAPGAVAVVAPDEFVRRLVANVQRN
jgi:hypothetical protein